MKCTHTHARTQKQIRDLSLRWRMSEQWDHLIWRHSSHVNAFLWLNGRSLVLVQYPSLREVLIFLSCTSRGSYWFDCSHEGQRMNLCYGLCRPFAHRGLAETCRGSLSALYSEYAQTGFDHCCHNAWNLWKNKEPPLQRSACRSKFFSGPKMKKKVQKFGIHALVTKYWHVWFAVYYWSQSHHPDSFCRHTHTHTRTRTHRRTEIKVGLL